MNFQYLLKGEDKQLCTGLLHSEVWCKCKYASCRATPIHKDMIDCYERLRIKLNVPLKINSGHRCAQHNYDSGGSPKSFHQSFLAIDIAYTGALLNFPQEIVIKHIQEAGFQFSYYDSVKHFFHCQVSRFL